MTQVGKNVLPIQGVLLALPPGPTHTSNSAINKSFDVFSFLIPGMILPTLILSPISSLPLLSNSLPPLPYASFAWAYAEIANFPWRCQLRMPAVLASFLAQSWQKTDGSTDITKYPS